VRVIEASKGGSAFPKTMPNKSPKALENISMTPRRKSSAEIFQGFISNALKTTRSIPSLAK
jgi:hypothetical protein